MALTVLLYNAQQEAFSFSDVLQFRLKKDVYTPYSSFFAVVDTDGVNEMGTIQRVVVKNGTQIYHEGFLEQLLFRRQDGKTTLTIRSSGFTKLLLGSQLPKGIYVDVTLQRLLQYYPLPAQITWENTSVTDNYIYLRQQDTVWNAIATLCYKRMERYPYVRENNRVFLSLPQNPRQMQFALETALAYEVRQRYDRMYSSYHMEDLDGNPAVYTETDSIAQAAQQIRHKQIVFDRSYLYAPQQAVTYRVKYADRGWLVHSFTVASLVQLDLNDKLTVAGVVEQANVSELVWQGDSKGITTTMAVYLDYFQNP